MSSDIEPTGHLLEAENNATLLENLKLPSKTEIINDCRPGSKKSYSSYCRPVRFCLKDLICVL